MFGGEEDLMSAAADQTICRKFLNKYNKYMKKYIIQIKKSYVGYD
jgi:hypothetical protein